MEGGRKMKLTSQISVLDPAKIRDLIKTREDYHNFRRDSALAGLTVDAVLGTTTTTTTSKMVDNQQGRTLLDIICSDEDNSGAAYRGLVAQNNKKNGKKNSKKSIKDRLRLLRSSRPVPTCDIPISNGRTNFNTSNPFPPPQPPKRSTSMVFPAAFDAKQVEDPIVPCYANEEDDEHEEQQQPMSKNHDQDEKPILKNDIDEPVSSKDDNDMEEEQEEHQPISKNQEEEDEEDEDEEEKEKDGAVRNAASGLWMNRSDKAFIAGIKEDEDDEDDDDEDDEEEPVKQVSLMALLEESMGAGDSEDEEEEDAFDIEDDVEVGGQYVCCVCMVRHNKGTCFSHCGHSFCRLCCKELFVSKGNCPRCNGYVMEIVEIF